MTCEHVDFIVKAEVNRLTGDDGGRAKAFSMDLAVFCKDCGLQFEFMALPLGYSVYRPTISVDGMTAHVPIMPPGKPPDEGMPGFGVTFTASDESALQ